MEQIQEQMQLMQNPNLSLALYPTYYVNFTPYKQFEPFYASLFDQYISSKIYVSSF